MKRSTRRRGATADAARNLERTSTKMSKVLLLAGAIAFVITPAMAQTSTSASGQRLTIKTKSSPPRTSGPEQGATGPGSAARGIEKKDIRRGMVIAKPGSVTPHTKQQTNPSHHGNPSPQVQEGKGLPKKSSPGNF
jgi:hypothetical protein